MIAKLLIVAVAAIHVYLAYVENFEWTTRGRAFLSQMAPETFEPSQVLAKNVGLYNLFLAAGLAWAMIAAETHLAYFFLGFIAIAGIFGAVTADIKLALIQTVPASLAIGALLLRL